MPIAKQIPGLRRYEVSTGPVGSPGGVSSYHLVALLHFESTAAIQKALGSAEGSAAAADLAHFATGGVDLLVIDTKTL